MQYAIATIANYWSLLCGSTVGYPSDSLASCHYWCGVLFLFTSVEFICLFSIYLGQLHN